jgi:hypothetical protein
MAALNGFLGVDNNSASFFADASFWKNNSSGTGISAALTNTHVLCLAIDLDNNKLWGRLDGGAWSGASGNPATNTAGKDIASINDGVGVYVGMSIYDTTTFNKATLRARASSFGFTVPSGFSAWDPT